METTNLEQRPEDLKFYENTVHAVRVGAIPPIKDNPFTDEQKKYLKEICEMRIQDLQGLINDI